MARAAEELTEGNHTWLISLGTSMRPAVKAVQRVWLRPVKEGETLAGQVVLSKVGARPVTHMRRAITMAVTTASSTNASHTGPWEGAACLMDDTLSFRCP